MQSASTIFNIDRRQKIDTMIVYDEYFSKWMKLCIWEKHTHERQRGWLGDIEIWLKCMKPH